MTPRAAALAKWRPARRAAHAAIEAFDAACASPLDAASRRDSDLESLTRRRLLQAARAVDVLMARDEFYLAATAYERALGPSARGDSRRPPIEEHDFHVADGRCDAAEVRLRAALEDDEARGG